MLLALLVHAACAQDRPAVPASAAPAAVVVNEFRVTGNTLLPQATIDAALAPYKGTRSVAELRQAAQALQDAYTQAGYGAVIAFVPEQAPSGGVVTINVLEGRISAVKVSGNRQFSDANVRAGVPALEVGATPRVKLIDAQLQMSNENPAKDVQLLLQPGEKTGDVEAQLVVTEQPVQRWSVALDNTGTRSTGDWRFGVGWQHANLFGRDHALAVQVQTSPDKPDAVFVLGAAYRWPLYDHRLVIDAHAAYSDVKGVNTAIVANDLKFNGKGQLVGVAVTRHLLRLGDIDQRVVLGFDHRRYLNSCTIADFGADACGGAGKNVSVQPISLEYAVQRGGSLAFGLSVSLLHNLQIGGGDASDDAFKAVREDAKPRYTALRASAFGGMQVFEDWRLQARAAAQHTGDALVPGEQFGIGGIASVRGYEERELAGDRGLFATFEVVGPNVARALGLQSGELRALAFVDGGQVQNVGGLDCMDGTTRCTLASVGVGAQLERGPLNSTLYVANARKAGPQTARNDTRAHFAVSYRF